MERPVTASWNVDVGCYLLVVCALAVAAAAITGQQRRNV